MQSSRVSCYLLTPYQKNILHLYFGISSTILDNVYNKPSIPINNTNKTLYFDKKYNNTKLINSDKKFKKIHEIVCFLKVVEIIIFKYMN